MKRTLVFVLTAVLCLAAFVACGDGAPKEFTVKIRGEVIDRPGSETLLLNRVYEDSRIETTEIPIVDGKFSYDLVTDTREMYQLCFVDEMRQGNWRPVFFFAEPGTVEFTLYPMERHVENELRGGKLNTEYAAVRDSIAMWWKIIQEGEEKLIERGYKPKELSMSYGKLIVELPDTSTEEGRALHEEYLALEERTIPGKELDYYRRNPSIVSQALMYREIKGRLSWDMAGPYIEVYNSVGYAEKYPDSPYTRELGNLLGAVGNIKVGGKYFDFTLPDLDGNSVTVSEHIAGRVALIDLWMTWCGPCRRNAMAAIPVYEEFKGKGFTVVGVSGDNSLDAIRKAAEQDGYPWTTLVDLKSAAGIWSKYGISGAGGASYLVDRDGTILAVSPNADQLRKILSGKL